MLKLLVAFKQRLQWAALAPILEQNERLVQRQEEALQTNSRTLEQFALALRDCAEQLARHTEAVKSMAEASQELRDTVREINEFLSLTEAKCQFYFLTENETNFYAGVDV